MKESESLAKTMTNLKEYVLELTGPDKRVGVIRWDGLDVFTLHYLIEGNIENLIEQAKFDGMNYQPEEFSYRLFDKGRPIIKGKFSPVSDTNVLCSSETQIHKWDGLECWKMGTETTGKKVCVHCGVVQKTVLSLTGHTVEYVTEPSEPK